MRIQKAATVFGLAIILAGNAPALSARAAEYQVTKSGRLVLSFEDRPGPIVGTALLPAGATPATNRFLSGTAYVPEEEDQLGTILARSSSVADFILHLRQAGYVVTAVGDEPKK